MKTKTYNVYAFAELSPKAKARAIPYSLPAIVKDLCGFRAECADLTTSPERLEAIAVFCTSGEVMALAHKES